MTTIVVLSLSLHDCYPIWGMPLWIAILWSSNRNPLEIEHKAVAIRNNVSMLRSSLLFVEDFAIRKYNFTIFPSDVDLYEQISPNRTFLDTLHLLPSILIPVNVTMIHQTSSNLVLATAFKRILSYSQLICAQMNTHIYIVWMECNGIILDRCSARRNLANSVEFVFQRESLILPVSTNRKLELTESLIEIKSK